MFLILNNRLKNYNSHLKISTENTVTVVFGRKVSKGYIFIGHESTDLHPTNIRLFIPLCILNDDCISSKSMNFYQTCQAHLKWWFRICLKNVCKLNLKL